MDRLSTQVGFRKQILELLPSLYQNHDKEESLSSACIQYAVTFFLRLVCSKCRPVYSIPIKFSEPVKLVGIENGIKHCSEMLENVGLCLETDHILCSAIFHVQRVVEYLRVDIESHRSINSLLELLNFSDSVDKFDKLKYISGFGLSWLYALIDLESEDMHLYPPTKLFVLPLIRNLVNYVPTGINNYFLSFYIGIGAFPAQEAFLKRMAAHPLLIADLFGAFNPNLSPSEFMDLFRLASKIIYAQNKISPFDSFCVFSKFGFETFIMKEATTSDCSEIFSFCVRVISTEYPFRSSSEENIGHQRISKLFEDIVEILLISSPNLIFNLLSICLDKLKDANLPNTLYSAFTPHVLSHLSYLDMIKFASMIINAEINCRTERMNLLLFFYRIQFYF